GRRMSPLVAAGLAVGAALVVAAVWWRRPRTPAVETAVEATVAVRITRHDALGVPSKPVTVRAPAHVRAIVEGLAVDGLLTEVCPPDYASADVGLVLSGRDVYARRNVYVWDLFTDGGAPRVLVTSSSGCRGGAPADAQRLRELLREELDAAP
ncbi:MAG: hypothetical protein K0S65_2745, partial [Labilithrix sp.]|nr:hypothetical protein [Labilithrix sp.]